MADLPKFSIPKPKQRKATPAESMAKSSASMRSRITAAGEKDPTAPKGATPFERLFGILDVPGAGARSLVHNVVNPLDDKDVNPLKEMGKAWRGEKRLEGSEIVRDLGVDNKWAQMIGGLALDIALDPTTYLTAGYGAFTKAESAVELANYARKGIELAKLADFGVDTAKYVDKVDDAGRVAAAALEVADSRKVASGVRKMLGAAAGDAGGLKFLGQTIIPDQGVREIAAFKAKDIARSTKLGEWAERAFVNGDLTDLTKMGNEVVNAGVRSAKTKVATGIGKARRAGMEAQSMLEKAIPDAEVRDLVTIGIGRQFGDWAEQGGLSTAREVMKEAQSVYDAALKRGVGADEAARILEDAQKGVADEMARLVYDPAAVRKTLEAAGHNDPALLAKVDEAVTGLQRHFDDLTKARGNVGLDNWTLYPGQGSRGYVPGMTARDMSKADIEAANTALGKARITLDGAPVAVQNLDEAGKRSGIVSDVFGTKPKAYKSKEYLNAEQRIVDGGLLTELDIAKLAGAKTTRDYADVALKTFEDDITQIVGADELSDGMKASIDKMRKAFTDDEAFKGFLGAYDKSLNLWKRWATVYNVPRFGLRNAASNRYLMWSENLLDPAAEAKSFQVLSAYHDLIKKGLTEEQAVARIPEMRAAFDSGVIQDVADLAEQVGGALKKYSGPNKVIKGYEKAAGTANAFIENQSRLSAFLAAKSKGLSDEAAATMVNKALYDYTNEAYTTFERGLMMRAIPFFRWMKSNTTHMTDLLFHSPGKLTPIFHAKGVGEDVNPTDRSVAPEWLSGLNPINTPLRDDAGNVVQVATEGQLPLGDLERVVSLATRPSDIPAEFLSSLSPLIKTPLEVVFNRDLYYRDEVSRGSYDVRRAPGYVEAFDDVVSMVPVLSSAWAKVKDMAGMVEKTDKKSGQPYLAMPAVAVKILKDLNPWMNSVGKMLADTPRAKWDTIAYMTGVKVMPYDTETYAEQKSYDDYAELQDTITRLRQQGKLPDTTKKKAKLPSFKGGE